MQSLILLCTLSFEIGLAIGWCWERADKVAEAYLRGQDCCSALDWEVWR